MNERHVKLLTQRYAVEQRIRELQNTTISESNRSAADALLAKLHATLARINESSEVVELSIPSRDNSNDHEMGHHHQELDHEVDMARAELHRAAHSAIALGKILERISEEQGLEGWVQAKITKAADYLDSVYHYLEYEMNASHDVDEGVAAYGPGEDPNDPQSAKPQAPGAPQQNPNAQQPGQQSTTPPAGGSTPGSTSPGMVKMAKLDAQKKPIGTPLMVKSAEIAAKQKQGFFVIGESKEEKKVAHCSQCGKGFSASGVDAKYKTGFSHCKDHKGMKVIAEDASAGASSAGSMGGSPTGFASGGIGMQKRKKKKIGEETVENDEPTFTGYWKGKDKGKPGKKMVGSST
jgi:hypothetical protein